MLLRRYEHGRGGSGEVEKNSREDKGIKTVLGAVAAVG